MSSYDPGLCHSYSITPWYLCQRLWSGNRSSCQRQTFCPDIKCLSAGHRCNLLAQTFRLTIHIFSHVHVKGESQTYFVWVTHLCLLPWITCGTECLFLITGKNRKGICLIRKLKKRVFKVWCKWLRQIFIFTWLGWDFFLSNLVSQSLGLGIGESCSTGFILANKRSVFMFTQQANTWGQDTKISIGYCRKATITAL